ncbi:MULTISPECIES: hypothetical protein [Legionella]|uniref:hypothetical protein n=1 Tax=Legionella TaxID=445 RepID=UPI000F8DB458|nr:MULTISPECIES: hypothetical protein [Legionella]MCP0914942.1 hypothetical protein [Legionella sp. 27cVA30]RUQ95632.1 hypothetical protein ELY11_08945 [Legionella septentrionalis]RUR09557.1 hypothetical protein ELY14_08230 [Legionella septentrionalis]RUR13877.1 hypothetical protein ELY10_09850 [Legionella septentrionalis]
MKKLSLAQIQAINAVLFLACGIQVYVDKETQERTRKLNPRGNLLWTLFVDGRFWKKEKGFVGYAKRGGGYKEIALASQAIMAALQDIDEELSIDVIDRVSKIFFESQEYAPQFFRSNLDQTNPGKFGLVNKKGGEENLTAAGVEQLRARIEQGYYANYNLTPVLDRSSGDYYNPWNENNYQLNLADLKSVVEAIKAGEEIFLGCCFKAEQQSKKKILEKAINNYNLTIKQAGTPEEKLKTIVEYVQLFEQIHPLADYNCRTFCTAILNRLLVQNGFMPAIPFDPNNFDMNSVDELVIEVKKGMKRTKALLSENQKQEGATTVTSYDAEVFDHAFEDFGITAQDFANIVNTISREHAEKMTNNQIQHGLREPLTKEILSQLQSHYGLNYSEEIQKFFAKGGIFTGFGSQYICTFINEICKVYSQTKIQQHTQLEEHSELLQNDHLAPSF